MGYQLTGYFSIQGQQQPWCTKLWWTQPHSSKRQWTSNVPMEMWSAIPWQRLASVWEVCFLSTGSHLRALASTSAVEQGRPRLASTRGETPDSGLGEGGSSNHSEPMLKGVRQRWSRELCPSLWRTWSYHGPTLMRTSLELVERGTNR